MKLSITINTDKIWFDNFIPIKEHEIYRIHEDLCTFEKIFTDFVNKQLPKKYRVNKFSELSAVFDQMHNDAKDRGGN